MTRARKAAKGPGNPPPLDRWIDAVLLLCVSLVQGVAATLGMILNRTFRDWHTQDAREDLPQAKPDIQLQKDGAAAVAAATRTEALPPPNGGGAPSAPASTMAIRWGTALTQRTVSGRGTTVPHLTCARSAHRARGSSPVRGRTHSAPA